MKVMIENAESLNQGTDKGTTIDIGNWKLYLNINN